MRPHPARSLVNGHEIVEALVTIHYLLHPLEDTMVQSVPPFLIQPASIEAHLDHGGGAVYDTCLI